jgi:RNA 3'-terminal phosphate cyclase (ATP)
MLKIDGSVGEGGGQVLRTALGLSALTGQPFEIENIRARRKKPGLMRQHLTAVQAAAQICGGKAEGASLASTGLRFLPGTVRAGEYAFAIGTAGSATLVLQTVLPPLLTADAPSRLTIDGGTHNPTAPPVDFLEGSFLPFVNRMGPKVAVRLERWGFYPAGGGRLVVDIAPTARLEPFHLGERSPIRKKTARAVVSNLPRVIAQRELEVVRELLGFEASWLEVREVRDAHGPGNVLNVELEMDHHCEVFTGFGQPGVPARAVAEEACQEARRYLASGQPVGQHLADQLLVPLAMAGEGAFRTGPPSRHTLTNIDVIRKFLAVDITCDEFALRAWEIRVGGHA